MPTDPYDAMTKSLAEIGLTGQLNRPDQLIVSAQEGAVWPNQSNSFWLSCNQGVWYLITWLPAYYRIPSSQDIVTLCSACMKTGTSAMYRITPEIASRFQLQEIDDLQFERIFPTEGEGD